MISDIATCLDQMHELGYVHFDIKPANILFYRPPMTGELKFKLGDFGLSLNLKEVSCDM